MLAARLRAPPSRSRRRLTAARSVRCRPRRSAPRQPEPAELLRPSDEGYVLETDDRGSFCVRGRAGAGGDGRGRVDIQAARLDRPGKGDLRARFDGSDLLARASVSQAVVRRAQVILKLPHRLEPARADEGVPIDVDVTSSRGPV